MNRHDDRCLMDKDNYGIKCTEHDKCETCGWNPEVLKKRRGEYTPILSCAGCVHYKTCFEDRSMKEHCKYYFRFVDDTLTDLFFEQNELK